MRRIALLGLCVLLAACAAPGSTVEKRALPPKSPDDTTQPVSVPLESSMPLYLWNEAQSRYELHRVDLATGQDLPGHVPFVVGENEFIGPKTLSADRKKLAIVAANGETCTPLGGGTACRGRADVLHIIDQQAWQEVTATLSGKGWAGPLSFSPDGMRLAMIFNQPDSSTVMLFDTNTGELIAQQAIPLQPSLMEYTSDGASLVLYGQSPGSNPGIAKPDAPRTILMDAATLEVSWEQELPGILSGSWCLEKCTESHGEQTFAEWTPAVVFSPKANRLYIVHANEEQLTTIDFPARKVHTVRIREKQSFLDRLLALTADVAQAKGDVNGAFKEGTLSQDGTRLFTVGQIMNASVDPDGNSRATTESLGLDVIEVATGEKLMSAEGEGTWIKTLPDQAHLLIGSWGQGQTKLLDTDRLQSVADLGQWEVSATRGKQGQQIVVASRPGESHTDLAVLDPVTFQVIHAWSLPTSYAAWVSTP